MPKIITEDFENSIIKGERVSEERIKEMSRSNVLGEYKIIHFAVHGHFDTRIPEFSCIVLSRPELIPEKECSESLYWLELFEGSDLGDKVEIIRILTPKSEIILWA